MICICLVIVKSGTLKVHATHLLREILKTNPIRIVFLFLWRQDLKATLGTGEGLASGLITFAFPSATLEISLSLALGFLRTEDRGQMEVFLFLWEKAMIEKKL